jgi:hypothetical protein
MRQALENVLVEIEEVRNEIVGDIRNLDRDKN